MKSFHENHVGKLRDLFLEFENFVFMGFSTNN